MDSDACRADIPENTRQQENMSATVKSILFMEILPAIELICS
jgi:hypothetical protein